MLPDLNITQAKEAMLTYVGFHRYAKLSEQHLFKALRIQKGLLRKSLCTAGGRAPGMSPYPYFTTAAIKAFIRSLTASITAEDEGQCENFTSPATLSISAIMRSFG